jgi:hypothetical protein
MMHLLEALFEAIGGIFESLGASVSGDKQHPKPRKAAKPRDGKP